MLIPMCWKSVLMPHRAELVFKVRKKFNFYTLACRIDS